MANIFMAQPDNLSINTIIARWRDLPNGSHAVVLDENPFRPAGGGQPRDYGVILREGRVCPVEDVFKEAGETWIALPNGDMAVGDTVTAKVDAARRLRLSQGHTLTHLAMASIRQHVPGYESKGADIDENGVGMELRFLSQEPVPRETIQAIDRHVRRLIAQSIPVRIERARSVAQAEATYPDWRIDPDLNLSGKIRVVVIEGVDANPCSGSHVASSAQIGPYELVDHSANDGNFNRIRINKSDVWTYWF
jgi:alanyl-tRNA synthetase